MSASVPFDTWGMRELAARDASSNDEAQVLEALSAALDRIAEMGAELERWRGYKIADSERWTWWRDKAVEESETVLRLEKENAGLLRVVACQETMLKEKEATV